MQKSRQKGVLSGVMILTGRGKVDIIYMRMIFSVMPERRGSVQYLSLVNLHVGDRCKVARIQAGSSATRRLYEMGFNTGAQIQVLKNDRGPIIVGLGGHKIALGRGLAAKMLVGMDQ